MNAGVTVRHTQQIGEILMNKKLVAIMTFVLVALGATMTITSHKIEAENPRKRYDIIYGNKTTCKARRTAFLTIK